MIPMEAKCIKSATKRKMFIFAGLSTGRTVINIPWYAEQEKSSPQTTAIVILGKMSRVYYHYHHSLF
jgi:hypothetical protein